MAKFGSTVKSTKDLCRENDDSINKCEEELFVTSIAEVHCMQINAHCSFDAHTNDDFC